LKTGDNMSAFDEPRARSLALACIADPETACCESDMEEAIVDLQRNQFNAGMERAANISATAKFSGALSIANEIRKEIE
jgi:hypothetical protein